MPEITVTLPTLHPGQVAAWKTPGRFKVIRCGRRWGKTDLAKTIACDGAAKGKSIGWFAPEYKFLADPYIEIADILAPVKRSSSKVEGVFRTTTGGHVKFWTLDNDLAGRGRKYHDIIVDEAAFAKDNMKDIWEKNLKPTLLDYQGRAWFFSNCNGIADENFFYAICKDASDNNGELYGFAEYHAPTDQNPHVPEHRAGESEIDYLTRRDAEFENIKASNHPLVYQQEYLAEFIDWSGIAFFDREKFLVDGEPVDYPIAVEMVFAVIDTAVKTGREHDGTAVSYYARNMAFGHPLVLLDWDIVSIEGGLLEAWLPSVYVRLEELSRACRARMGSRGAWIEDKVSGSILLQQARRRAWPAHPIDSKLTAAGKDERAISVSGYAHRGMVKISRHAYDKP